MRDPQYNSIVSDLKLIDADIMILDLQEQIEIHKLHLLVNNNEQTRCRMRNARVLLNFLRSYGFSQTKT